MTRFAVAFTASILSLVALLACGREPVPAAAPTPGQTRVECIQQCMQGRTDEAKGVMRAQCENQCQGLPGPANEHD